MRPSVWYVGPVTRPVPTPSALLLDYGGTLDGDALHWFDHFLALYDRAGRAISAAALKPAFYSADESITRDPQVRRFTLVPMIRAHVRLQLAALGIDDAAFERRLVEAFVDDTRAAWNRNRTLLRRLAPRFRLGVVSNSYGNMAAVLAEADLAPFALILDSAVVGLRKPDPAIYALAARRLELAPDRILHVGDSWERDVTPARAVGMRTAWLAHPDAVPPVVAPDVWRIASVLELEALLA
jgi:HAD superfamily hydrolase (TIGR01549 family)